MLDTDSTPRSFGDTGEDSLRRYLAEIGRYPLLTRAEEVQLAKRIEAGDPVARQRLTESNLRLVVAIARNYRSSSIDLLDLVQEGTLGLMKAVEKYDWRRGVKFSTYAAWWIRHGIVQALGAAATIRVPDSVRERLGDIRAAERELTARLGRPPSVAELADRLELTPEQVAEARAAVQPLSSLHDTVGSDGDGDVRFDDVIADPNAEDPLQSLVDEVEHRDLAARLRELPERPRRVIELRFGLRDGVPMTADAVAAELGLARERVRQIELKALRQLGAAARPVDTARAA